MHWGRAWDFRPLASDPTLRTIPKNPTMPYTQCITSHTAHIFFPVWWALWRRNCENRHSRVATSPSNTRGCYAREWTNINKLRKLDTCLMRPFRALLSYTSFVNESMCIFPCTAAITRKELHGRAFSAGNNQGSGDFWAQPAKIRPFTTSTAFFRIWPFANLLPLIWTGQYIFSYKCQIISSSL